jgi:hypothetical protein
MQIAEAPTQRIECHNVYTGPAGTQTGDAMSRMPKIFRPTSRRIVRDQSTELSDYPIRIAVGRTITDVIDGITISRADLGRVLVTAMELDHFAVAIISLHGAAVIANSDARRIARDIGEMLKTGNVPILAQQLELLNKVFSQAELDHALSLFIAAG